MRLFGVVGTGRVIRNVGVVNVNVTDRTNVGGLVGAGMSAGSSTPSGTPNQRSNLVGWREGMNTAAMKNISTFSGAGWNIVAVDPYEGNPLKGEERT